MEKEISKEGRESLDRIENGIVGIDGLMIDDEVLKELAVCVVEYRKRYMGHEFHSLEILNATISFLQ